MEIEITHTIRDVDEKEWMSVVGTDFTGRSHGWFRTIEDSGMRDMQYILLREGGTLKAAACCYAYKEKRFVEMPFLEVRSPFGTEMGFFSKTTEHTDTLLKELETIQKREKTKGILLLELRENNFIPLKKKVKKYTQFSLEDDNYIDLHFNDFEDYLSVLDATARRSIRKTMNRAANRWNIKTIFTSEFSKWKSVARRLQGHLCEEHKNYRAHLTEQFYEAIEHHMKDTAELVLCFKDDIPLASGLVLNSPTIAQHKLAGIDPDYRKYQAYFLAYYEGIKRAIEKRQKRIYFGPTTYEFKEKIGCKRENVYGLVKMRNPFLHVMLISGVTLFKLLDRDVLGHT